MAMTTPWTCPVCGAGVAPWVERCVHAIETKVTGVVYAPETDPTSGPELYGDGKGNFVKQSADYAPSDDGWIEWKGGACPVSADCHVEVKLRDGYINDVGYTAKFFGWERAGKSTDIIAYRVVRP